MPELNCPPLVHSNNLISPLSFLVCLNKKKLTDRQIDRWHSLSTHVTCDYPSLSVLRHLSSSSLFCTRAALALAQVTVILLLAHLLSLLTKVVSQDSQARRRVTFCCTLKYVFTTAVAAAAGCCELHCGIAVQSRDGCHLMHVRNWSVLASDVFL